MKTLDDIRQEFPVYKDVPDAELSDALYRKFYAGRMDRAEFDRRVSGQPEPPKPSDLESLGRGALDMATFGFDDEIGSGLRTGFGFLGDYGKAVQEARDLKARAQQTNPIAYGTGQIAGAIPSAFIPLGAAARGAGLAAKMGRGALTGAAMGGVYGAGAADENKMEGAKQGAIAGGVLGGALPAVGNVIGKTVGRSVGKKLAPAADAIKNRAQDWYTRADDIGLVINQPALKRLSNRANAVLYDAGVDSDITPKAFKALQNVVDEAANPGSSLKSVELLRRKAMNAANVMDGSDRALGSKLVREIDDFFESLTPADVNAADRLRATRVLSGARQLYRTSRKTQLIEDAMENAKNAASGYENGLRNEFRKFLKTKNGRNVYGFTSEEVRAIRRVIHGGGPASGNLLRLAGTFGIPVDQGRNWLGAVTSGGLGTVAVGPLGGAAALAVGTGARKLSQLSTRRAADLARATAALSGRAPMNIPARYLAEQRAMPVLNTIRQGGVLPAFVPPDRQPSRR